MDKCQSCGMPMDKPEDHGGGKPGNPCCKYCTDSQGNLLPRETVRSKMIQFQMQKLGKTQEQAGKDVDQQMALMPAWKAAVSEPAGPMPGAGGAASQPQSPLAGQDKPIGLGVASATPAPVKPLVSTTPLGQPTVPKKPFGSEAGSLGVRRTSLGSPVGTSVGATKPTSGPVAPASEPTPKPTGAESTEPFKPEEEASSE